MPEVGEEFDLLESVTGEHTDRVTIIGTIQHPDGRLEIKTTGKERGETEFCYDGNLDPANWLVLGPDPMTGERCFSTRGPRYSLVPVQKN